MTILFAKVMLDDFFRVDKSSVMIYSYRKNIADDLSYRKYIVDELFVKKSHR